MEGKSKIILIAAALLAGLAIGFAASTLGYRYKLLAVPGENLVERMNRVLDLTPSQREQIIEVMEETRAQMFEMQRHSRQQRRHLTISTYLKIRSLLNPDQQKKFDDQFIPAKFREEARRAEQGSGGTAIEPSPVPSP